MDLKTMYEPHNYYAIVYWAERLIAVKKWELQKDEKELAEYKAWWQRFITYCHTGK